MAAFAGESQARNKYTYFASKARKEGYVQIAKLFEETAASALKKGGYSEAVVIKEFALVKADPVWVEAFVKELSKRGKAHLFNTIAYHHYKHNPDDGYEAVEECRALVNKYTPNLKLKEGEGGTQSEWCRNGALSNTFWTEWTQAKHNLRRALGDLGHGDDTEVFHLCDLEYDSDRFEIRQDHWCGTIRQAVP